MTENDLYLEKLAIDLLKNIKPVEFVAWNNHLSLINKDSLMSPRLKHMTKEMVADFYEVQLKKINQHSAPSRNGKYLEYSGKQVLEGNECNEFHYYYRPKKEVVSASYLEGICRIAIFSFQSAVHFAYLTDMGYIGNRVSRLLDLDKYIDLKKAFDSYKLDFRQKQRANAEEYMKNVIDMKWDEFENLLVKLYKNMGYKVSKTKHTGDFGADLIAIKGSDSICIEAKHYNRKIVKEVVKNVFCAKHVYKTDRAIIVTINDFTKPAYEWGEILGVELINYSRLEKILTENM
jgi:hypothetical protein